jgi:serine/threonine-protein kinase
MAFDTRGQDSASWDVSLSEVGGNAKVRTLFATTVTERGAVFSPDGRLVAYESNETGRSEIYAQAFPGGGGKRQISADGGSEALWSANGREIFFRSGDRLMSTEVDASGAPASRPRVIFEGRYERLPWGTRNYDVSRDGQRFLMLKSQAAAEPQRIVFVQSLGEELRRLLPAD